jgi:hypothetical protein
MIKNFNKALLAISVVGLGSVISAPAFAQTYASGSSTIVLMNGASQSVGAEISLPAGTFFGGATSTGNVIVTPTLAVPGTGVADTGLAINEQNFSLLNVNPGVPGSVTTLAAGATTFTAAAAKALERYGFDAAGVILVNPDLAAQVSIIRAGAGVDGLD